MCVEYKTVVNPESESVLCGQSTSIKKLMFTFVSLSTLFVKEYTSIYIHVSISYYKSCVIFIKYKSKLMYDFNMLYDLSILKWVLLTCSTYCIYFLEKHEI